MPYRWFLYFIALVFPSLYFLMKDNPGAALVAFLLQTTLIGWLPASIWAMKTVAESKLAKKEKVKPSKSVKKEDV